MQKILIVDDDPNIAILVKMALSAKANYRTEIVNSGSECLDKVKDYPPDLILLDVMMPGMDGFEVCKRLKANEATRYIPVIMITAKTEMTDKVHGMEIGANDYITKPFSPDELLARVQATLKIKELELELVKKAELDTVLKTSITLQHEINNPLTGIIGNLEYLEEWESMPKEEIKKSLEDIYSLSIRIRDIVVKMNNLTKIVTTTYVEGSTMIDVEQSAESK